MRKRRVKSVGQILSEDAVRRWVEDLKSYSMYRKWAGKDSWAAAACERILARYPKNLHKHFTG